MAVVIPSSILPPRAPRRHVRRARLEALAESVGQSRQTIVSAPAGYGKTTIIRDWTNALKAQGRPILWIAARAGIRDGETFLETLRAAGQAAGLGWSGLSRESFLGAFYDSLAAEGRERPVLVIDDAHYLAPAAVDQIVPLIGNARDALTTIASMRGTSVLPTARLRSLGYLVEVTADQLRFSVPEAADLARAIMGRPVDEACVHSLVEQTGGWAAGLVLGLQRQDSGAGEAAGRSFSGASRVFAGYFDEEVLGPLPAPMQKFLMEISLLDDPSPAECLALTGTANSGRLLDHAEAQGLFIEAIDEERTRYRIHPLFRTVLQRRLMAEDADHAALMRRRASHLMIAAGKPVLALRHAAASGEVTVLADILDETSEQLTYDGFMDLVIDYAQDIPWDILSTRPGLLLTLAWRKIRRLSFAAAEEILAAADKQIALLEERYGAQDPRVAGLMRLRKHRTVMLHAARDDMPLTERESEALLHEFGDENAYLSCTLLAQLMAARRETYHFHDTLKLEAETRRALSRPGSTFASIALKASIAPTLAVQGKVEGARKLLEEALALSESLRGRNSGLAALPALPLAELHYDLGDLDRAFDLMERHLAVAREWGWVDQLSAGHLVRVRLLAAENRFDEALRAVDEAHLLALECGLDRLRGFVVALQVHLLVKQGRLHQAIQAFRAGGFDGGAPPMPSPQSTRYNESVAIAWIRLETQQYRLAPARKVARRWIDFVKRAGAVRSQIQFELLLVQIALLAGEKQEAGRALRDALTLAAPTGWIRIFLDEGPAIGALLADIYGEGPLVEGGVDRFAAKLLAAFEPRGFVGPEQDEEIGLADRFGERELEILTMIDGGLRNREIGDRLGLTEGTVKWYVQEIFDKLSVRRRTQAVIRARQLGVLG